MFIIYVIFKRKKYEKLTHNESSTATNAIRSTTVGCSVRKAKKREPTGSLFFCLKIFNCAKTQGWFAAKF